MFEISFFTHEIAGLLATAKFLRILNPGTKHMSIGLSLVRHLYKSYLRTVSDHRMGLQIIPYLKLTRS